MFPILFDYRIKEEITKLREAHCVSMVIALPWPMIEAHEKQAQKNHSQSVARLAERGGLSAREAVAVLEDRDYYPAPTQAQAHARLKELFSVWQRGVDLVQATSQAVIPSDGNAQAPSIR